MNSGISFVIIIWESKIFHKIAVHSLSEVLDEIKSSCMPLFRAFYFCYYYYFYHYLLLLLLLLLLSLLFCTKKLFFVTPLPSLIVTPLCD